MIVRVKVLFFKRTKKPDIRRTRVVVCSLDASFDELLAEDGNVYSRFYPNTIITRCHSISEFQAIVDRGCDIVHLLCDVSPLGVVTDASRNSLTGRSLIHSCCLANVKLLWLASNVNSEACVNGFKIERESINLVLTADRRGIKFSSFLEQLLSRLSAGKTLPLSWVEISPQTARAPEHHDLPVTIFVAGLGGAVFR
jgi:hypothetical protein